MQTFLEEVVDDILSKHDRLEKLCIIFPNHWSRSFFKKVFSEKINKTSWLPSLYSMNEWVVEQSSYKIINHIQIILDFYDVYQIRTEARGYNVPFLIGYIVNFADNMLPILFVYFVLNTGDKYFFCLSKFTFLCFLR